jgi:hypothetical protein
MKQFNEPVAPGRGWHEPELPKLKRSKNRLRYDGFADDQRMLMLLEEWVVGHKDDALEVVKVAFGDDDTPPMRVWPTSVNFLAYAKKIGDFLANVTFSVDYLFITDYSAEGDMAHGEHNVDLWITLDPTRRNVVDVVVDTLNTLPPSPA